MKTKLLFTLFILCYFSIIKSQTSVWQWAEPAGGNYSNAIATTTMGESYVVGTFSGQSQFGNLIINNSGQHDDVFLAKYDKNGVCLWVKQGGGIYNDEGTGVDIDKKGNIYVTGHCQGSFVFGGLIFTTNFTNQNAFVVKYDSNGNELWMKVANDNLGASSSLAYDIAVDNNGNAFITGVGTAPSFSNTTLPDGGYITKFDTNGNVIFSISTDKAEPKDIAVDRFGNVYTTGNFMDTVTISNQTYYSVGHVSSFLLKLNNAGLFKWFNSYGGASLDAFGEGVSADINGNVYFTGNYYNVGTTGFTPINFGLFTLTMPNNFGGTAHDLGAAYVVKCDSMGKELWATQNIYGDCKGMSIINDKQFNTYVAGYMANVQLSFHPNTMFTFNANTYNPFILKLDAQGKYVFSNMNNAAINSTLQSLAYGISLDSLCGVYIAGSQLKKGAPEITFGSYISSNILHDGFIAKSNGGMGVECNLVTINSLDAVINGFEIYPNPAKDIINIKYKNDEKETKLCIYNLLGEIVYNNIMLQYDTNIDVSEFSKGVYIIEILNNTNQVTREKFVKN